jgi:hypothetical protein
MRRLAVLVLFASLVAAGCTGEVITRGGGGGAVGDDDDTPAAPDAGVSMPGDPDASDPGPDPGRPDAEVPPDPQPEPDAAPPDPGPDPDPGNLTWRKANLTNFTSYPEPGSDECENFNGCMWAGRFAFVNGQQSLDWVMQHNIVAVHERDADQYALKTLRLRQDDHQLDVVVYDECADSDCSGCCTHNADRGGIGFLIDIESYTMERFGSGDGVVEFACLDCN